jgi:hypothetical protein
MKKTLTMLGVLVALIALILVINKVSDTRKDPLLFKGFDKAKITRVTVSKYNAKEVLKLDNKKWTATAGGDYPADTAKVATLLNIIADQRKGDPSSRNPAKQAELKVDSAGATKVVLEAGVNKWVFFIGSMAQGFSGNYLRFDGKNEVYVSKGNLEQAFSTTPDFYRDKALLRISKDNVAQFDVVYKQHKDSAAVEVSGQFNVEKASWKLDKPESADGDGAKINEYLAKICGLEVDEWYDKDTATALGFDNPMVRVSLKKSDGSTAVMLAGAEKSGSRYVKVEGDNNKYLLRSYRFDALKPNVAELKAKAPAPGDTAKPAVKPMIGFPQGK